MINYYIIYKMLGIIYYWTVTINFDKFDNVDILIFTDQEKYNKELIRMNELNNIFNNYTDYKTGDTFVLGDTILFENFEDLINFQFAYFIVTYRTYYCHLELYTIADNDIDTSHLMSKLSNVTLTGLHQPYTGGILSNLDHFMNNDNFCLVRCDTIKKID